VTTPAQAPDPGIAPLFEHAHDLVALERMLIAWSLHPEGGAFARARLFVWDPVRSMLVGRQHGERPTAPMALGAALGIASRQLDGGADPERTRRVRSLSVAPGQLAPTAGAAWNGEPIAIGVEAGAAEPESSGGHPVTASAIASSGSVYGAVKLMRSGRPFALLVGEWEEDAGVEARLTALEELRRLGEAALESERERAAARRHARQVGALAEVARAGVSALNLAELLPLAVRTAVETCGARGGAVWLLASDGAPALQATEGPSGARERMGRALTPSAARVVGRSQPRVVDHVAGDPELALELGIPVEALAIVPLAAYGTASGALAVYDRLDPHPGESAGFDRSDLEFLGALADLVALAVEQARRTEALGITERRQHELQRQVARLERLAALGEMAARVAHEVRNPLASIGAFARRAQRPLAPEEPAHEYLEIVIREAERLERMVGEQLQYATLERPRLKLESVNAVVQQSLQAAGERLVRRRVRLLKRLSPDLPPLLLDAERIGRVVGNIIDHALESVAAGGRLRIESRRSGAFAVVEIAHDGLRQPGELLEQLFVPFAVSRQGGPGVGLAVAQQVLKQHGGEIRVRGEGEWSSIFSLTLPIPENEDRRRTPRDRRHTRPDRRTRAPLS
jgi:signal transduction histidine kinase